MATERQTGLFITLEGGEGSGKSTQALALDRALTERGHEVVRTREPGGTPVGHAIRKVLLDADNTPTPMCELLLFFASRAQHIEERIRPALERGATVICDRYSTTTLVYQGLARGLGEATVMTLASMVEDTVRPDLSLVLDIDPEVALTRVDDRGDANRLDREPLSFHQTVRTGFRYYAEMFAENHRLIDADTDAQTLTQTLLTTILEYQRMGELLPSGAA
jgi:dTMP kinase